MCTVSFIARQRGYLLGMNRDEKLSRPEGLPPERRKIQGRSVLCPSEPSGGTWISLNDAGVTFALINWYSVPARVQRNSVSRGDVVNAISALNSPDASNETLKNLPLHRINAFRLIGIFSATRKVVEWRWNLKQLVSKHHSWKNQQWISSGFDEPQAQRVRGKTFRQMLRQDSPRDVRWLRRLHRSHSPEMGPFSTCMHRADAATVSYTEVAVSSREATMRYHAGAPCQNAKSNTCSIRLRNKES